MCICASALVTNAPIKCPHLPHLGQTLRLRKGLLMTVEPKGWGLGVRMRFFVVVHDGGRFWFTLGSERDPLVLFLGIAAMFKHWRRLPSGPSGMFRVLMGTPQGSGNHILNVLIPTHVQGDPEVGGGGGWGQQLIGA